MNNTPRIPPTLIRERHARWPLPVAALLVGASLAVGGALMGGCNDGGTAVATPTEPEQPLPEQRFERIVEDLKESLQINNRAPRRVPGGPGGPSAEWTYKLEDKLIEPEGPGENYRGVITITTESTITIFSRSDDTADDESDSEKESARGSLPENGEESEDGTSTESNSGSGASALRSTSPIKRHESDEVQQFELEYIDNRWRLLTMPEKDSALETMFDHAIDLQ